ncbi:hypothetical protein [Lactococcus lactis]|uniref:hypothetical protein n=1 Tax=Lactococcus lactis TaxID=1358 RepID=UPI0028BD7743|nr:hypothetical protein [Lactococcus lactis]WNN67384.1 hypothetical protein RIN59_06620 [Lactococcus lactis]WPK09869.1 hypothetical protein R6U80_04745 [Lactococcus lactis]
MEKSNDKEVNIKIVFTKKLLIALFAGMMLFLFCIYLLIMITVNHRNPFNGLKYVPSNMIKIPIDQSENWKISKDEATKKLRKSGFKVEYVYNLSSSDDNSKGEKSGIDGLEDNKETIQFYSKKRSDYDTFPINYGYDVKGIAEYAPKGSKIIVRVRTKDINKVLESRSSTY